MQVLIIYCLEQISSGMISAAATALINASGRNELSVQVSHLTDQDLQAAMLKNIQPNAEMLVVESAINNAEKQDPYKDLDAAITYLTAQFGDPLDSTDAFRARLNKAWYRRNDRVKTPEDIRLTNAIQIFAGYNPSNRRSIVSKRLEKAGFHWLPSYATELYRFENM